MAPTGRPPLAFPPVVPLLRSPTVEQAVADAERVLSAGAGVIELTTSTDGWTRALAALVEAHPQARFGVGTIRDADDVRRAAEAGAAFVVSPTLVPAAREAAEALGLPLVEGGLTPSELRRAAATTAWAKLFPAAALGPDYLRLLRPALPGLRVIATGGIGPETAPAWIAAGADAVALSCHGPDGAARFAATVAALGAR
ncbi:MAG: bifunctional 4-hydroxy-2-oxoglutarate aldolase/2-dehydro-3-deoxy-phosphogluconate aldolase [Planctomycetaceae bacterium]